MIRHKSSEGTESSGRDWSSSFQWWLHYIPSLGTARVLHLSDFPHIFQGKMMNNTEKIEKNV
jgi:hypothetical protein